MYNTNSSCCSVTKLCLTLCDTMNCSTPSSSVHGDFSDKNTGVGYHLLLQAVFLTMGSNPSLLHWQVDSLPLSHQESPLFILESESVSFSVVSDSLGPSGLYPTTLLIHGIVQARILEWAAIHFCRGFSGPRSQTQIPCIVGRFLLSEPPGKYPLPHTHL